MKLQLPLLRPLFAHMRQISPCYSEEDRTALRGGNSDLKARSPPELLEVSGRAASPEAPQNSAGRRQSPAISQSAAAAPAEYKAEHQRAESEILLLLCRGEKFDCSRVERHSAELLMLQLRTGNLDSQNHRNRSSAATLHCSWW